MVHNILNAYHEALEFELPRLDDTSQWKRWIDTALDSPDDICNWNDVSVIVNEKYLVQPHSVVILVAWSSDTNL
jgi:glycogen operon protein